MSWSYEEDERKSHAYLNHDPIEKENNIYKDVHDYLNNDKKKKQYNEMKWVEYEYQYVETEKKQDDILEECPKEDTELNENLIQDDKKYAYF